MRPKFTGAIALGTLLLASVLMAPSWPAAASDSDSHASSGAVPAQPLTFPGPLFPRPPVFDDHVYHHYPDLTTELQDLANQYPDIAKLSSIGKSVDGRELWQMEITDFSADDAGKSTIYVDGGHHGNEQLGMELAVQLIHEALSGKLSTPEILARYHFFIVPMINPDGNMRDQRQNANGVDLNRNYAFEWTDEADHGSGPESEPESHANAESMRRIDGEFGVDLYLTGHTGTNILIYSWAWTLDPAPDDDMFYSVGSAANNLTGVAFGQTSHELYIATGSSKDLGYGELGAPSFTYEVDNQQTRQGTYTTTIAQRLADEVEVCLFLIENVEIMRADLRPTAFAYRDSSRGPAVSVTIENRGWASADNASATLRFTRGGGSVREPTVTFSMGAQNTTTLEFPVESGGGNVNLTLDLSYKELRVDNATVNQSVFYATVPLKGSGLALLVAGGPGLLLLVVVAAAAIFVFERRSHGRLRAALASAASGTRARAATLPRPRLRLRRAGGRKG